MNIGTGGGSVATNTAFGTSALQANTTGSFNVAVGYLASYSNTTGTRNNAFGPGALYTNTTGANNTAIGDNALSSNTTASNNTAVGYQAGYANTTGYDNTFIGYAAGSTNTTGYYNTFVGDYSGYSHTTGVWNTCIGKNSGYALTTGSKNTIIGGYNGNAGGLDIRTASNNIVLSDGDGNPALYWQGSYWAIGNYTGAATNQYLRVNHTTGSTSGSTFVGFTYNSTFIGDIAQSGTTAVAYNTTSDYRLKNTITPMTGALAKVALLKPCTYKWNADGSDGQGFIAHELQAVVPDCVTGEKDAVDADGKPVYQGIDVSFLVATLTAAIQEQQALITSLTTRITALEAQVGA
jgi:hypothetical protein